jgi:hypothetical protein
MVAVVRATQGDIQGALNALNRSDSSVNVDAYVIDIAERLAERGDLAAAASVIPKIDGSLRHVYQSDADKTEIFEGHFNGQEISMIHCSKRWLCWEC